MYSKIHKDNKSPPIENQCYYSGNCRGTKEGGFDTSVGVISGAVEMGTLAEAPVVVAAVAVVISGGVVRTCYTYYVCWYLGRA